MATKHMMEEKIKNMYSEIKRTDKMNEQRELRLG